MLTNSNRGKPRSSARAKPRAKRRTLLAQQLLFRSGELFEFVCADPRSSRLAATSTRLPIAIIPTRTGNPNAVPVVAAEMMISVIMAVVTISVVAPVIVISRSLRRNKTRNTEHRRKH